ncbi:MAG: DUF1643 domain-containing protein, partial [Treponema sp.]|nr:DUF1643 domain-containing protein [Treponema sp.]
DNFINFIFRNPTSFDGSEQYVQSAVSRAETGGFDGVLVTNIFAEVNGLETGPENDRYIQACAEKATIIVAAWGNDGLSRQGTVMSYLPKDKLYCFGKTGKGAPKMPAYSGFVGSWLDSFKKWDV